MSSMHLKIVTPERVIHDSRAMQITVPTLEGEVTILPHHSALVGVLKPGEMIMLDEQGKALPLAVSGGFLQVADNEVVVLADTAERADEIIEARAEEARKRATDLMADQSFDRTEYATLAVKMEKELARLHVARKYRHKASGGLARDIDTVQH